MLLFWWCTLLMVVNMGLTIKSPGADIDESAKEDQTLTTLIDPSNVALLMFWLLLLPMLTWWYDDQWCSKSYFVHICFKTWYPLGSFCLLLSHETSFQPQMTHWWNHKRDRNFDVFRVIRHKLMIMMTIGPMILLKPQSWDSQVWKSHNFDVIWSIGLRVIKSVPNLSQMSLFSPFYRSPSQKWTLQLSHQQNQESR